MPRCIRDEENLRQMDACNDSVETADGKPGSSRLFSVSKVKMEIERTPI
jgi:hypothetical protein